MKLAELSRSDARYWCFRFQSNAERGVSSKGAPRGLKPHIEKQELFDGWENFGDTWDLDDGLNVVVRRHSIHEEWTALLRERQRQGLIPELPTQREQGNGDKVEL